MTVPQPYGIAMRDWADQVVFGLDNFGLFTRLDDEDWQRWGEQFLLNVQLSAKTLPQPRAFTEWVDWAQRFCEAIN